MMRRECVCKSVTEHVNQKTPELLRYSVQISCLCRHEHPQKTALEDVNQEKTLTVRKVLFRRDCVPLAVYGCMAHTGIQQHPFWERPWMAPHYCCACAHMFPLEDSGTMDRGTADERRQL